MDVYNIYYYFYCVGLNLRFNILAVSRQVSIIKTLGQVIIIRKYTFFYRQFLERLN